MQKAFSESCERNKAPILEVLREIFGDAGSEAGSDKKRVLEIGCGSGQHAVHFAAHLPHVTWQPSNQPGRLESMRAWAAEADLDNLEDPIEVDLLDEEALPGNGYDAIVASNVIHIAPWPATDALFALAAESLKEGGIVFLYGPYRYESRPLEPSNEKFDMWLQARSPASGLRVFEEVDAIAEKYGFELVEDRAMPANNRAIWWRLGR
ncbi:MAG: DUF938 domain-containing protein [Persicimonas sp.]